MFKMIPARYLIDFLSFSAIFADPPYVMVIQTMTAPPNLAQHFPAGRLVANPVDPVD
jgi:hypothetical protein